MEISLEQLKSLNEYLKNADLSSYISQLELAQRATGNLSEVTQALGKSISDAVAAKQMFTDFTGKMADAGSEMWNQLQNGVEEYKTSMDLASHGTVVMGVQGALALEPMFGLIPEGIKNMSEFGTAGAKTGNDISDSFGKIAPLLGGAGEKIQAFFESADRGFNLEENIIAAAQAQGNFNSMLDVGTGNFKDMNQEYMDMVNLASASADATGQTIDSVMKLSGQLSSIPGALTESFNMGDIKMSQLTATSRIATAFMQDQADVAKRLSDMYTNVGLSGTDAFSAVSNIYEQAGDSKLRFDAFADTVTKIADSFKMVGDTTGSTTNMVKAFDNAFKDSDISPAAMEQIISKAAEGIRAFDAGKQAFVSAQTGGPGGLAGAMEIELLKSQGKNDEVLAKTMEAMKAQFGGDVMTLEDTKGDEAAATEFYKQASYLIDVAGVAEDLQSANRLLQAEKAGLSTDLMSGQGRPTENGVLEAIDRGEKRTADTKDPTIGMVTELEKATLIQQNIHANGLNILNQATETNLLLGGRADQSASAGAIGSERLEDMKLSREDVIEEDFNEFSDHFKDMFMSVMATLNGRGGESGVGVLPQGDMINTPPGADAQLSSLANIPVGQEFAQSGSIPVEVTHAPIDINVKFDGLDQMIKATAESVVQDADSSRRKQGGIGG